MAQETNEGIAYLRALKHFAVPSASGAATAPAQETPAEAQAGGAGPQQPYRGAEKRRSVRYKCEGSVELREKGCDVHTWATFTDISLHGCYVEAQATYPVGTALGIKLEANGQRVESGGTVRVNYPYLGMGIAFQDMSDENCGRLKELLGTLARPVVIMGPGVVSSGPAAGPMGAAPKVSDHQAAVQAMIQFFEEHHMLTREDFLRLLRKSQDAAVKA